MSDTPYIVSARKYRPATFRSVVGQRNLTDTLKNAVSSGRLAQAYLFCGPRGVGKTSCARIFAKTINCLSPTADGEACGQCDACRAIEEGNSFNIVELDAASNNSVDNIRAITEQVNVPPSIGKYRVFIIDEVHMLSSAAFNAFLKTLEEPPSYVVFILATTEKHKVIPTILSRCQIYDFKRITIQDMVEHLQYVAQSEGITADTPSLNVIAKKADGAMRDALSIFDQVAASSRGNITYESTITNLNVLDYDYYFRLVDAFRNGDVQKALMIYKEIRDHGFDTLFFVNGLATHIRDLMVAFSPKTTSLLEVADDIAAQYSLQAHSLPIDWLYAAMRILNDCDFQYRLASNKQFLVELTLIRLCQLLNPPTPPFDRVDSDINSLKQPRPTQSANQVADTGTVNNSKTSATNNANAPHIAIESRDTQDPTAQSPLPTTNNIPTEHTASATIASDSTIEYASTVPQSETGNIRKTKRTTRRPSSIHLSEEAALSTIAGQYERRHNTFDIKAVTDAWEAFIIRNPDKHILISAMRKSTPEMTDAATLRVLVDHPAVKQAFETAMSELITYLRDALENDFVVLEVEIDENKNVIKKIPQQDLLKEITQNNPAIANFLGDIEAELI